MMRRLTFFLTLSAFVVHAHAQVWTAVDARQYNDETVVYAALNTASTNTPSDWVVGAFIGEECRAEAAMPSQGPDGSLLFVLRVAGDRDADFGKKITFSVYHKTKFWVFECTASQPVVFTTESEGTPSSPVILSFTAEEPVPLEAFEWEADPMFDGEAAQLRLTPRPVNANTYKAQNLILRFEGNSGWEAYTAATSELLSASPIVFLVTPTLPGSLDFFVARVTDPDTHIPLYKKDDDSHERNHLDVSFRLTLHEGWHWRANPYGHVDFTETDQALGPDLIEVRTIDDLLYNDPEWGYFGTLVDKGLGLNKAYKVRMDKAFSGTTIGSGEPKGHHTEIITRGWNWIPSPYFFDHPLTQVFSSDQLTEGMVIVAKEQGQAEWNGSLWEGDLEVLPARQGFLFYNPGDGTTATLKYQPETEMEPPTTDPSPSEGSADNPSIVNQMQNIPTSLPWGGVGGELSPHRFRDNMTVVAALPALLSPDDYLLGAFVGGEFRGSGRCINGRFWLTVHCNGGEQISFQLINRHSGQMADISESVICQQLRLGSLREPFIMHAPAATDGICNVELSAFNVQRFDLSGRPLGKHQRRGLVIERSSDGTARRIIR